MFMDIVSKIIEITAKAHGVPADTLTKDTHFFEDLDDSLEYVEILMHCEEEFGVRISDKDAIKYRLYTIGWLAAYISARRNHDAP